MMPPSRKHRIFWYVMLASPIFLLFLLESGLRVGGYGHDLSLVKEVQIGGKEYFAINPHVARRYFLGSRLPAPKVYDDVFLKVKTPSTYRIFCLGESTMQGFPYEYNGALPRLLYDRLHLSFPARNIEVINLGITAVSSAAVVDLLRDVVDLEPDMIIVYAGHNEFYGALGTASIQQVASAEWFLSVYLRLTQFRTFQLVQEMISRGAGIFEKGTDHPHAESMMEFMADEKAIPLVGQTYTRTKERFRDHLNRIADIAGSKAIPIILSTTVSNLKDMNPFVSLTDSGLGRPSRESWAALLDSGKSLRRNGDPIHASKRLSEAWRLDSSSASLAFEIAGSLLEQGDSSSARQYFERSRDLDALRFRASSEFNDIVRSVCRERKLLLADIESSFANASEHGIIGRSLVLEHVHPNIEGYFLMATTYADVIRKSALFADPDHEIPSWPDEVFKSLAMMTMFDFEVSFFRIDDLLHRWPFSEPESTRHAATTEEGRLAQAYISGRMTWEQAHYRLASMYISQQRLPEAIREYLALAKVFWYDYQPLMFAGDQYLALGSIDEARSMYARARVREENPFILVRLGAAFAAASATDSAVAYYREALKLDDAAGGKMSSNQRGEVLFRFAELLVTAGKTADAETELDRLFTLNPGHEAGLKLRARIRKPTGAG